MIRHATAADREAIAALHLASWQASYGVVLPEAVLRDVLPGYLARKWEARGFGPDQVTLVAAGAAGLDGFACALTDRPVPLIDNLHVRPSRRGGGIGAALLAALLDALRAAGAAAAELTVLERNPRAHAFYLRHGGRDIGGEDDRLAGRPVRVRRVRFDLA